VTEFDTNQEILTEIHKSNSFIWYPGSPLLGYRLRELTNEGFLSEIDISTRFMFLFREVKVLYKLTEKGLDSIMTLKEKRDEKLKKILE